MAGQEPIHSLPLGIAGILGLVYCLKRVIARDEGWSISFIVMWVVYACVMCWWMTYFGFVALVAFGVLQALYAGLVLWLARRLFPWKWMSLGLACLWVSFEWFMSHIPILNFSWLSISTIFVDSWVVSLSRLAGGTLLSFLAIFLTSAAIDLVRRLRADGMSRTVSDKRLLVVLGSSIVVIGLIAGVSQIRLGGETKQVSIAAIQGNDKNRYLTQDEYDRDYLQDSHIALAQQIQEPVDYLIFPESAFRTDPLEDPELAQRLQKVAPTARKLMILNSIARENESRFNRNYFFSPQYKLRDFYDKQRLVPFGEYVPGESLIGSWPIFDAIGEGFDAGSRNSTVDGVTTLICYESTFTDDVKKALNGDAELLVITTNNRSYRRSGNSQQHLAQTQMRAAEYGISIVQASVSGQSALIERDGSVIARTELFTRSLMTGSLSFGRPDSIYARTGDWLSLISLLVVGYIAFSNRGNFSWKSRTSKN